MGVRYHILFAALVGLCLAGAADAQNLQVSGTTDADGVYVNQEGTLNGKTFYQVEGDAGLALYYCDRNTFYNNVADVSNSCNSADPGESYWVVASEPYAGISTPSNSVLYFIGVPDTTTKAPTGTYAALNGASANAVVSTPFPVGVEPSAGFSGQRVWLDAPQPNPAQTHAQISLTVQQTQPVTVQVYDMLGRIVQTLYEGTLGADQSQTLQFERGSLPAGIYLIRLLGSEGQATRQLTLL